MHQSCQQQSKDEKPEVKGKRKALGEREKEFLQNVFQGLENRTRRAENVK
jgi:FixJ family two-component response regulator